MSGRKRVSPIKTRTNIDNSPSIDERQLIIGRLKEQLIVARGKQKQVGLIQNYLDQLILKTKLSSQQLKKKQYQGKSKSQGANRAINELKRQLQDVKSQLKSTNIELGQLQSDGLELQKHNTRRNTQVNKLKKQCVYLKQQCEQQAQNNLKLSQQANNLDEDLRRLQASNKNYEIRINQIQNKIIQVRAYIGDLNDDSKILKQKLRNYQDQNNNINQNLQEKQTKIDQLQYNFQNKHIQIKQIVDQIIQLQHVNGKSITQTAHKLSLLKSQNQKTNQLNTFIKNTQNKVQQNNKKTSQIKTQIHQINQINQDYDNQINQMKKDYEKCQIHLENLMKFNSFIKQELQNYLKEDQHVIATLQKKRILPPVQTYTKMRQSRKNNTARTARTFDQF